LIRFIIRRLLSGLLILFLFQTAIFFIVQIILPGDFVSHLILGLTLSEAQEMREAIGLDQPLWEQYLAWLMSLLQGDLGRSYTWFGGSGASVVSILKSVVPASILVFGLGTLIAFMIGQWLGKVTAWRGPGFVSGSVTFSAIALYTSFPPWLAFLMIYFLVNRFGLLPRFFDNSLWMRSDLSLNEVMLAMTYTLIFAFVNMLIIRAIYQMLKRRAFPSVVFVSLLIAIWVGTWQWMGIFPYALNIAQVAALPLLAFVLLSFGEILLIMRASVLDTMHEPYIVTARAKGLPDRVVRDRHVTRNAILPVISALLIRLPILLTGAVMIEQSLNWEGIGTTLFFAVGRQDIFVVMGLILVIGVISIVTRIILDITHAALDPRIRYDTTAQRQHL
jgi:peptide/nickel transport system permease protein